MGVVRKSDAIILYCITTSVKKKHFPWKWYRRISRQQRRFSLQLGFRCANGTKRHYSSHKSLRLWTAGIQKKMLSTSTSNLNATFMQHKSVQRSTKNVAQHVTVKRDWTKLHGAYFKYLCPVQSTSLSVQKISCTKRTHCWQLLVL